MLTKSVNYAYPSSHNATVLGFKNDGCWHYSAHLTKDGPGVAEKGFKTAREAYDYAYSLNVPWNSFWFHCLKVCCK